MRKGRLYIAAVMTLLILGLPAGAGAAVMMTGSVSGFSFDVLPTSNFSPDEWFSTPGLWTLTIANDNDGRTIKNAVVRISISAGRFGEVLTGNLRVVDSQPNRGYLTEMLPGTSFTINNTMIANGAEQMTGGEFDDDFIREVLRIGYLPEGTYTLRFALDGYYDTRDDHFDESISPLSISETIEIRNPRPPELVAPADDTGDVVTIPRFVWQRPRVSDYSSIGRQVEISYTINIWKMFTDSGAMLQEEDAINGIPVWTVRGWPNESIDFNPGTAIEELLTGHRYCWQVQAFDGTGRPIGIQNDGKSDIWQFSVQFIPPLLDEVTSFDPLRFRWSPARSGGAPVQYRIRIADNPEFTGAYVIRGLAMTSLIYPPEAPQPAFGAPTWVEVQATDDRGAPVGDPSVISFTMPSAKVALQQPADGTGVSSLTPTFTWQGAARYHTVSVSDREETWKYRSGAITGGSWRYDGDALMPGITYAWYVTPVDESGREIGEPSETSYFTVPATDQVVPIEPVSTRVSTLLPVFRWRPFSTATGAAAAPSAGSVTYTITISGQNGEPIHAAESTSTEYTYPDDAPALKYGAIYRWQVTASIDDTPVSREGAPVIFMTPVDTAQRDVAGDDDIRRIIERLVAERPELSRIGDKTLAALYDETGAITPAQFLDLLQAYRITAVRTR